MKKIIVVVANSQKTYDQVAEITKVSYNAVRKQIDRSPEYFMLSKDGKNIMLAISPQGEKFLKLSHKDYLKNQEEVKKRDKINKAFETIIEKIRNFFYEFCQVRVSECVVNGKRSITIEFKQLQKFDMDLANDLIEDAGESLKKFDIVCEEHCNDAACEKNYHKKVTVRFHSLPEDMHVKICDLRENLIGKMILVRGDIRQKTPPKAVIIRTTFSCPSCGNEITIIQNDDGKYRQPNKCACGRKGNFIVIRDESRDEQRMVISESLENIEESRQPRILNCLLLGDLTDTVYDMKTNPGNKIEVVGVLGVRKVKGTPQQEYVLHVNNLKVIEEDYSEVQITDEDIQKFEQIKNDECLLDEFASSAYYEIYGHDHVKRALILQQLGGSKVNLQSKTSRANSHIALVGDPSTAKSDLLRLTRRIAPKSRYAVGSSVSKAGLTACVKKDEFLGDYVLEGGVIPLANKGLAIIDELDKCSDDDKKGLNEPLENETVTIDKANIHAVLPANTTMLVAANPKHERFDNYKRVGEQIDLPNALFTRFDLIFVLKDIPDADKDDKIANSILCRYNHKKCNGTDQKYSYEFIRKYIAYAKRKFMPTLTEEAQRYLQKLYVGLRKTSSTDGAMRIAFTPRQLEGTVRLSQAYAKLRMMNEVTVEHCKEAQKYIERSQEDVGRDPVTGLIDVDMVGGKETASSRAKIQTLREALISLTQKGPILLDDAIAKAKMIGIDDSQFESLLNKLRKDGDIHEPKRGYIEMVK